MRPVTWHNMVLSSVDDTECSRCEVVVSDDALDTFQLSCPTERCTDPSNDGYPCVFVPGEDGPECAYCGRSGVREDRDLDVEKDDEDQESPDLP